MKDSTVVYTLAMMSLCLMAAIAWMGREQFVVGGNDFVPLYTGPLLLETGQLYDNAALLAQEREATGMSAPTNGYIRPPFVAALMRPLSYLPYEWALRLWQAASLAAIVAFALIWTPPARHYTALLTCLSFPALLAWSNGQDTPLLLLVVALTARLHSQEKRAQAGFLFALCAAKAHLFLLTPVWILARRDWRFLRGSCLCGFALFALSTWVAGWAWPVEMWREVHNPQFSPNPHLMPNLHAAFLTYPGGDLLEAAFSAATIGAVWVVARRLDFLQAFGAALVGGALLARHSYAPDLLLVLPACLTVIALSRAPFLRILAVGLLLPPAVMAIHFGASASLAYTLALWALLVRWAWEAYRGEEPLAAN